MNKDLAEEKQHLSSLKVSLSQSFSKTENDQSDREIKEKARKLVLFQRRLLAAFQVQKSIAEKMKERKLKKKNQISRYILVCGHIFSYQSECFHFKMLESIGLTLYDYLHCIDYIFILFSLIFIAVNITIMLIGYPI